MKLKIKNGAKPKTITEDHSITPHSMRLLTANAVPVGHSDVSDLRLEKGVKKESRSQSELEVLGFLILIECGEPFFFLFLGRDQGAFVWLRDMGGLVVEE